MILRKGIIIWELHIFVEMKKRITLAGRLIVCVGSFMIHLLIMTNVKIRYFVNMIPMMEYIKIVIMG